MGEHPADGGQAASQLVLRTQRFIREHPPNGRPFVTLTFAQSLDGSIASGDGKPLQLSGEPAMKLTHKLRASHDGILVGIGTVLADNPSLTVRLCCGEDPTPIILDGGLRTPLDCKLVAQAAWKHAAFGGGTHLIIVTTSRGLKHPAYRQLACAPGVVLELRDPGAASSQEHLSSVLRVLSGRYQIRSLMVEGGAHVIGSFMELGPDSLVVTVAPVLVGGLSAVPRSLATTRSDDGTASYPWLRDPGSFSLGRDMVVYGRAASSAGGEGDRECGSGQRARL